MNDTKGTITLNGKPIPLEVEDLAALLEQLGYASERSGIAVALNGDVVPRARWALQGLDAGDSVDIVGAVQGG